MSLFVLISSQAEETKVLRLQLEVSQAKGDLERRLQEKEEEAEAARFLTFFCCFVCLSLMFSMFPCFNTPGLNE